MEGIIGFVVVVLVALVPGLPLWSLLTARAARRRIERLEGIVAAQQTMIDALEGRVRELGRRAAPALRARPAEPAWRPPPEVAPAAPIEPATLADALDEATDEAALATQGPGRSTDQGGASRSIGGARSANEGRMSASEGGLGASEGGLGASGGGLGASGGGLGASGGGLGASGGGLAASEGGLSASAGGLGASEGGLSASAGGSGASAGAAGPDVSPSGAGPGPYAAGPGGPASAPAPARAAIDWEALLGVRGAAWIGAVALVIAGSLFAKYSFEHDLIPPAVRVALIILSGAGALLGAELVLRRGYATTANAACGAGVALLYAGFFAAHAVYKLMPVIPTFGLMALATVVACLLALRHDAIFIAVLGLLGGFATPLLLSTGQDRPVGLFGYVLLLDLGLLFIAQRRRWSTLAHLSLAATLLLEVAWFGKFMAPHKTPIAAGAFGLFGLLYLIFPSLAPEAERRRLLRGAMVGGLAPFLFVAYLAPQAAYAGEWPILFLLMGCLDAAIAVLALRRAEARLLVAAAVATVLSLWLWAADGLDAGTRLGATAGAAALCALLSLPPRLATLRRLAPAPPPAEPLEVAALIAFAGLWGVGAALIEKDLVAPPWALLLALAALIVLALERGRRAGLRRAGAVLPLAVALLAQAFVLSDAAGLSAGARLRDLAVPLCCAAAFSLAAALRTRRWRGDAALPDRSADSELGAALAALVSTAGLIPLLGRADLAADPRPLAASLVVGLTLLWGVALRRAYTALLPIGLVISAALWSGWHRRYFHDGDLGRAAALYGILYLAHLGAPLLVPPSVAGWRERRGPWLTAALSGPLFFMLLRRCYVAAFGAATIGALPVAMAALSLLALAGVRRRFPAAEEALGRQRLRNLAMLAAVALGFISVAIPLQLERQWITIGWALESAAVLWLYGRLPHPGLKHLGGALGLAVAARLLLNPAVLRYAERGWPVLNWILYTYGVSAAALLVGAALLAPLEEARLGERERRVLGPTLRWTPLLRGLALLLVFALINLEIADSFSTGRFVELSFDLQYARDLTTSVAWGLYALCLLGVGMWRRSRALRFVSLGFMLLCLGKVALHDLSRLEGLYQVLSFLGLALSLILVSLLYQRFVFRKEKAP